MSFSAGWTQSDPDLGWSAGAARQSAVVGAQAAFTFSGTSVRWIGNRNVRSGIALVKVDAGPAIEVDLFARSEEVHTPVITLNGLSSGRHTLTIEVTGRRNPDPQAEASTVVVDAFEVQVQAVSHLQETDPDVAFSAGWRQADPDIAWSGGGVFTAPDPAVGGARVTETPGAKATLTFRGTAISWSGARSPSGGIASVSVDGGAAIDVDTYSPTNRLQAVVFTATALADATHTLTIEATGRKNAASTGAEIVVDAFDVTTPGRRYQEEDAAISYSGAWFHDNRNRTWSEGSMARSDGAAGARVTFAFTGTSVSWIGLRKLSTGLADVYLDGVFVERINTYLPPPIEAYQTTVFRADGLANGPHTLTIEAASTGGFLVVDAFDVRP